MVRKSLLSAAVLGLVVPAAAFATSAKPIAKKTAAKNSVAKKSIAPSKSTAKKAGDDTCEFQVRTRSKVGYRGSATYWVKGPWVREEKRSGGGMELVMVNNDKGLFIRNKHSKYWFRYPETMAVRLRERLLGGPVGEVKSFLKKHHATYIGKEKVEGTMRNVFAYRMKGADDKFRLWTDLENAKPIRLERDHLVPGTKKRDVLVIEYKTYTAGQKLADSIFLIPEGQKIHDLRDALKPDALRKRFAERKEKRKLEKTTPTPAPTETPTTVTK